MKKYKNNYPMYMNILPSPTKRNGYEPMNSMPIYNAPQKSIYMPEDIRLPESEPQVDMDVDMDVEIDVEADLKQMKDMYPDTCKKIQVYVDEACDKMEYEGSMMYDQYPDRGEIERVADAICKCIEKDGIILVVKREEVETTEELETRKEVTAQNRYEDIWARELVELLLLNELFGRRRFRHGYRGYRRPYNTYESRFIDSPYQSLTPYQQYPFY